MKREYKIRLSETSEVKDFVTSAEKCDFDIDICYNRFIIDAKSILGVLSLDLTKVLTVKCAKKNVEFEKMIQKYCVA
ncbi:HPr family phosphocarrier protein [Faecalimonas sp.]